MDLSASLEHPETSHVHDLLTFSAMYAESWNYDIMVPSANERTAELFHSLCPKVKSYDIIPVSMTKVSPSVLSADFSRLGEELRRVEYAGADWVHIDVMDGMFVPNITIGPSVVQSLRSLSKIPFDVHLMIEDPVRYVEAFSKAGADMITVHAESKGDIMAAVRKIRSFGRSPGISINPGTPFSAAEEYMGDVDLILIMTVQPGFGGQAFREDCVPKISQARRYVDENNLSTEIVIDGGINRGTGKTCVDAGATVLAAGSSLFNSEDMKSEITLWKSFCSKPADNSRKD